MSCVPTCVRPTPAQAHCAAADCHRTFGSVTGFDRHRRDGACVDPATLGMSETGGVWRIPVPEADRARLARIRNADSRSHGEPQSDENGPVEGRGRVGGSDAADSRTEG